MRVSFLLLDSPVGERLQYSKVHLLKGKEEVI